MLQRHLNSCYAFRSYLMGTMPSMGFATKVMGGNTNNKKDSAGRRLGVKKWGHTAEIFPNDILVRQRGFKWHPGINVLSGKDHTLHSTVEVGSLNFLNLFRVKLLGQETVITIDDRCESMSSLWNSPIDDSQHHRRSLIIRNFFLIWVITILLHQALSRSLSLGSPKKLMCAPQLSNSRTTLNSTARWLPKSSPPTSKCTSGNMKERRQSTLSSRLRCTTRWPSILRPTTRKPKRSWDDDNQLFTTIH